MGQKSEFRKVRSTSKDRTVPIKESLEKVRGYNTLTIYKMEKSPFYYVRIFEDDLPPTSRTKLRLVKSVKLEQDGHEEEQIYRRTDHWLSQAG